MKALNPSLILGILVTLTFGLSSCSKCYECQAPIQVTTPDSSYTTYQSEEICTANSSEISDKEADGYICN